MSEGSITFEFDSENDVDWNDSDRIILFPRYGATVGSGVVLPDFSGLGKKGLYFRGGGNLPDYSTLDHYISFNVGASLLDYPGDALQNTAKIKGIKFNTYVSPDVGCRGVCSRKAIHTGETPDFRIRFWIKRLAGTSIDTMTVCVAGINIKASPTSFYSASLPEGNATAFTFGICHTNVGMKIFYITSAGTKYTWNALTQAWIISTTADIVNVQYDDGSAYQGTSDHRVKFEIVDDGGLKKLKITVLKSDLSSAFACTLVSWTSLKNYDTSLWLNMGRMYNATNGTNSKNYYIGMNKLADITYTEEGMITSGADFPAVFSATKHGPTVFGSGFQYWDRVTWEEYLSGNADTLCKPQTSDDGTVWVDSAETTVSPTPFDVASRAKPYARGRMRFVTSDT